MPPYVYERQTEYWTSRAVEDYFLDAGFDIATFPISQIHEPNLPADFVFSHPGLVKIFGFQYKALYPSGGDHWKIDSVQHSTLQPFAKWIYYGMSELKDVQELRAALHRLLVVNTTFAYTKRVYRSLVFSTFGYRRWGGFVRELEGCKVGKKIATAAELASALRPIDRPQIAEIDSDLFDVFLVNLTSKTALHFSPAGWPIEIEDDEE